jgi:transcriptional regulator with XRE-family HTH domain
MPESFGARLRQRRERQQIALSTIAEATKIKVSLLEALERDDVSHWPSGIFRRAFIRAYAHAIGLEPDIVVREFLDLYPDPAEVIATMPIAAPGDDDRSARGGPPTRLRNLFGSAMGSLSRLGGRSGTRNPEPRVEQLTIYPPFEGEIDAGEEFAHDTGLPEIDLLPVEPVVEHAAEVPAVPPRLPLVAAEPEAPADSILPANALPAVVPPAVLPPAVVPVESAQELLAFAELCTALARVDSGTDIVPLLEEATRLLDAVGLIVWIWDARAVELRPAVAHGYSDRVLAQLPRVDRDTNNATAAAFRAAQTCVVHGTEDSSGALVVPLMTPAGCAGVLALELQHGREARDEVRALAMIFAAQLAALVGSAQPVEASDRRLA